MDEHPEARLPPPTHPLIPCKAILRKRPGRHNNKNSNKKYFLHMQIILLQLTT
jgi:hypothetical protein